MSSPFVRDPHVVLNHNLLTKTRHSLGSWLLVIALTFALLGEALAATDPQQTRPRVTAKRSSNRTQLVLKNTDDGLPEDPAIVAESRRLEARKLEDEQKGERQLLAKNETAQTKSTDLWQEFRGTFPFHSQVIALSDPAGDSSRTLLISEPPPHVTLGNILTTVGADLLLSHQVKKHIIGYDGWVKDVVLAIKGNDEDLQAMLSRLNQRLFFTSYKSYTLKLGRKVTTKPPDLNLTVTPEEIRRWVVGEREQFLPVEGGIAETLTTLAAQQSSGVYISRRRGLIGLWIPKKRNLYECRTPARQFTLDADLIIGAVASTSGIFVLGRERIVPIDILPPLRFETLALLADVQDGQNGQLAQSYERFHPFAGRIEGGKDWAPILLSPQLRDTEYGSLLNITDQLLKGWSNVGQTKYHNFPYPDPGNYPFPKRLREHLGIKQALVFNWNTKGAGYTVNFGSATIMALNRSGALPVSYIPAGMSRTEPAVIAAEDVGYDYFSRLSDPNLVRVVQYATIYQIFSVFNIARSREPVAADSYPEQLLKSLTENLSTDLRQAADSNPADLAQQLALRVSESFGQEFTKEQREAAKNRIKTRIRQQLELNKLDQPVTNASEESVRREVLSQFASLRRMPERYAQAIDQRAKGWIHTPVVVLSWNDNSGYSGGHNLDARVARIVADEGIVPGRVGIDGKGNLLINPKDLPRARELARSVERNELMHQLALAGKEHNSLKQFLVKSEMQEALKRSEIAAVRPREIALELRTPPPVKPPNKPPISTAEPGPAGGAGWGGGGRDSLPIPIVSGSREPNAIWIKLRENGRYDLEYSLASDKQAVGFSNLAHEDAVDVAVRQVIHSANPGEPVVLKFDGMPEHKVRATLHTMEIRMGERGQAAELIGRVPSGESTRAGISRQYDFARATVETPEVETLSTGELQQTISLKIPAVDSSGSPLSFTSEAKFNKLTPRNVVVAVRERVVRAFNGIATRWSRLAKNIRYQVDVGAYNAELARAVKKIKVRTKLDFDVKTKLDFSVGGRQGKGDVFISREERTNGESAPGFGASQSE